MYIRGLQSTSDLVTVNLVANFDLVAIFRKTVFLCSKNSRFSGHFVKLLTFDLVASKLELASVFELLNQRISIHFRTRGVHF